MKLIPSKDLETEFPKTWAYIKSNRKYLESREGGAFKGKQWYAFGRSQALDVIGVAKIFTPDLAPFASYSFDPTGEVYFTGGVAGGYGILPKEDMDARWLLAVLNSNIVDFLHHKVSTAMRGGWFSYESRFIKRLPVALAEQATMTITGSLVDAVTIGKKQLSAADIAKARETQSIAVLERLINGVLYEIYIGDGDKPSGLAATLKTLTLPNWSGLPDTKVMSALNRLADTVQDRESAVGQSLEKVYQLEAVRMVESQRKEGS